MTFELHELRDAVNLLIHAHDSTQRIKELEEIIEKWEERPMVYAGHLEPLNRLIDVGRQDMDAFHRLVRLVRDQRQLIPALRRMDYQRELMRERRARLAKAVQLRELRYGEMTAREKERYRKEIQQRWSEAREKFIQSKGRLSWHERNEASNEFWRRIDKNLDESIKAINDQKLAK